VQSFQALAGRRGRYAGPASHRHIKVLLQLLLNERQVQLSPNAVEHASIGLLWGNQMTGLLLGVAERPSPREITRRAEAATAALLRLFAADKANGRKIREASADRNPSPSWRTERSSPLPNIARRCP